MPNQIMPSRDHSRGAISALGRPVALAAEGYGALLAVMADELSHANPRCEQTAHEDSGMAKTGRRIASSRLIG
jgi:hypothetical protein